MRCTSLHEGIIQEHLSPAGQQGAIVPGDFINKGNSRPTPPNKHHQVFLRATACKWLDSLHAVWLFLIWNDSACSPVPRQNRPDGMQHFLKTPPRTAWAQIVAAGLLEGVHRRFGPHAQLCAKVASTRLGKALWIKRNCEIDHYQYVISRDSCITFD